jgi:hypothetical protein
MNNFYYLNPNFINKGLYSLGFSTSGEGQYLGGSDAKNFTQQGVAIQYVINGVKLDNFLTRIIHSAFYFSTE